MYLWWQWILDLVWVHVLYHYTSVKLRLKTKQFSACIYLQAFENWSLNLTKPKMCKCSSLSSQTLVYLQSLMPCDLGFKTALSKNKKKELTVLRFRLISGLLCVLKWQFTTLFKIVAQFSFWRPMRDLVLFKGLWGDSWWYLSVLNLENLQWRGS